MSCSSNQHVTSCARHFEVWAEHIGRALLQLAAWWCSRLVNFSIARASVAIRIGTRPQRFDSSSGVVQEWCALRYIVLYDHSQQEAPRLWQYCLVVQHMGLMVVA